MTGAVGNFAHLKEFDPPLAALGGFAEHYFTEDANTAIIKTRQFAERLARVVAERSGVELKPDEAFVEILRALQFTGSAPREILDILHRLRKSGNTAVHDMQGERRGAFDALKLCHRLGVWLRATITRQPTLTIAFVPPAPRQDDSQELRSIVEGLREKLAEAESEAERHAREAAEAATAQMSAEERAALAEQERDVLEQLALEAEKRSIGHEEKQEDRLAFATAAVEATRNLDLDEADTRVIVDEQLRAVGWEVDSTNLRHSAGTRPRRNRNLAIAEWPTATGPADYALFVGEELVGVVEAKRKRKNVAASVEDQAERYARGLDWSAGGKPVGGPWGEFRAPFAFAANGRGFFPQFPTQSGIWFRDLRRTTNAARPLEGWPTPEGLLERLSIDEDKAQEILDKRGFEFQFKLRPYQIDAIKAVEAGLANGCRKMLVAMATGTGKTKLSIALIYRLLEAKRFNRICFVVDRNALGEQAQQAFETTKMVGASTFADIFGLKGLEDREIDRDVKVHVCTVQSLVNRILARSPEERPPVDQYDFMMIDECHRGYLLDREMSDAELTFRNQEDYVSKYRRAVEYFDAVKVGLTATPALHTAQIFGNPIYRYSYRDAVIDGWLIDHDPPHLVRTALSQAGITFEAGETIEALNLQTGETDTATLDDRLDFTVENFNRKVLSPEFNRVVAEELADRIDILDPKVGKTLVFAASDRHADEVVFQLRKAYRDQGVEIEDSMIRKITGSIDDPRDTIRKFKNEDNPQIAVTVDLLLLRHRNGRH